MNQDRVEASTSERGDETRQESVETDILPPPYMTKMFELINNKFESLRQDVQSQDRNLQSVINNKFESLKQDLQIQKEEFQTIFQIIDNKIETNNNNLKQQLDQTNNILNTRIDQTYTQLDEKITKTTQTLEQDILKRVENQVELVDQNFMKSLEVLNIKIEAETVMTRQEINKVKAVQNVCHNNIPMQVDANLNFNGDRRNHPKIFMKNLREYIDRYKGTVSIKQLIRNTLKGDAEIWYSIVEDKYVTVDDFEILFLNNYWGENYQSKIRENLFNGRYVENTGCSREKYILMKYSYVRHLEPRMPDVEIVKYFARHFNESIRDVILIQGIDTLEKLLQYLRRLDDVKMEGNNNYKGQNYNNNYRGQKYNNDNRQGREDGTGNRMNYQKYQNNGYTENNGQYQTYKRYERNDDNQRQTNYKYTNDRYNTQQRRYDNNYNDRREQGQQTYYNKNYNNTNKQGQDNKRKRDNEQEHDRRQHNVNTIETIAMIETQGDETNFRQPANQM